MTDASNTAIWKSLFATDPKFTKAVSFGQKFTSINAQWQIQKMTEQFGPVGKGWGYTVEHSIERIADDYVLAVADVELWWGEPVVTTQHGQDNVRRRTYGPVRGMCPIVEKRKSGLVYDDDAGKKAATDALTKGLSHLGLSADVFLGLYDDHKYVKEARDHFAEHPHDNDGLGSSWGPNGKDGAIAEAEADGLRKNAPEQKPEIVKRAKERADKDIAAIQMSGHTTDSLRAFWEGNRKAYEAMEKAVPAEFNRIESAYLDALDAASARAA